MKTTQEIMMTNKQIRANKIFKIIMFSWLLLIVLLIVAVCLGTFIVVCAAELIYLDIGSIPLEHIGMELAIGATTVLIGMVLAAFYGGVPLIAVVQAMFAIFSFVNVTRLFVVNKPIKRKPIAIIFRVLTVLFGIALIVSPILLLVQVIPVYTFLRCVVLFFIGSIVLNIFIE